MLYILVKYRDYTVISFTVRSVIIPWSLKWPILTSYVIPYTVPAALHVHVRHLYNRSGNVSKVEANLWNPSRVLYYLYKKQAFYQIITDALQLSSVPHLSCTVTHLSCMQFSHLLQPMCVREDDSNHSVGKRQTHSEKKSWFKSNNCSWFFIPRTNGRNHSHWHEGVNSFCSEASHYISSSAVDQILSNAEREFRFGAPLDKMVGLNYDPKLPFKKSVFMCS